MPKKKKGGGHAKGSSFERAVCKDLSLWWTKGKREDVFWRTSGSGARAKTRSKTGGKTFGQYGDVQATDPIGQPLIDLCTIEIKKGYNRTDLSDLLDKQDRHKPLFEQFIWQAWTDSQNSGTPYWMLLSRRDGRRTVITIPRDLFVELKEFAPIHRLLPRMQFTSAILDGKTKLQVYSTPTDGFFKIVKPKHIKQALRNNPYDV